MGDINHHLVTNMKDENIIESVERVILELEDLRDLFKDVYKSELQKISEKEIRDKFLSDE